MTITEREKYHLKYALYQAINERVKRDTFVCGQVTAWFEMLEKTDIEFAMEIKEKVNSFLKDFPHAIGGL